MFKKVLIANRGEIALRIIRACKELGIRTVAIHSEADATTLYVKKADEAALVGPGPLAGYLNIYGIIDLARQMGADAIHPGYGFLSENAEFAQACADARITFIGPHPQAVRDMGLKIEARQKMAATGVPVIPGTPALHSEDEAVSAAEKIGYPVILKASAGGGGRGLRVCRAAEDIRRMLPLAIGEAKKAFGNDAVFIEKYIEEPHHIEFQIVADRHGNVIHLGERDCSIQRRHQKLVEIAPSLLLDEELRNRMGEAAVTVARSVGYDNVGTVEFLVDKDRKFYFLEMNTRIQVEHTITEEVTGIDLLQTMIRIAAGEKLTLRQEDVHLRGYAIQCRVNAEDPQNDFLPSTGKITGYYSPGGYGVRIDGNVYRGYTVTPYYDSLLAKLIVKGETWDEAVRRMHRCLSEYVIRGIKTTIPYYKKVMEDPTFISGKFTTKYIEEKAELLNYDHERDPADMAIAIAAAIVAHSKL
ncbi:MAG: acetyl-CoA carboxylase biotin carboxylase subunit [Nitrospirae bacterium GWC2_57_13]|jgi:acetyl-CoA carboxylase biotin carboxylase subunit|nr:MAG: acetyl-CoA carboxylase biotin carboxylase subunit [Nitrospirae bacterium GWC2_57_13]OGW45039.1 MAG: acetyl-CoA carboxylase biotin carboxylase subunit [Nitrospirae bacterium GWD2_57_8]HAS54571.1 acetyl-CoA carboxylase biotin carboxylase subunit [Nitrospiraceae bacterium]